MEDNTLTKTLSLWLIHAFGYSSEEAEIKKVDYLNNFKEKMEDNNYEYRVSNVSYFSENPHPGYYCCCGTRLSEKNKMFQ